MEEEEARKPRNNLRWKADRPLMLQKLQQMKLQEHPSKDPPKSRLDSQTKHKVEGKDIVRPKKKQEERKERLKT